MVNKTIIVNVQIQMDISSEKDSLTQVQDILELVNKTVSMSELESEPQIFISDISNSDIIENSNSYEN